MWISIYDIIARSKEAPHRSPVRHKKKWERLDDLKGYFFQSGFDDPNPEDYVYSFFEPYVGIKLRTHTQVCECLS